MTVMSRGGVESLKGAALLAFLVDVARRLNEAHAPTNYAGHGASWSASVEEQYDWHGRLTLTGDALPEPLTLWCGEYNTKYSDRGQRRIEVSAETGKLRDHMEWEDRKQETPKATVALDRGVNAVAQAAARTATEWKPIFLRAIENRRKSNEREANRVRVFEAVALALGVFPDRWDRERLQIREHDITVNHDGGLHFKLDLSEARGLELVALLRRWAEAAD